MWTGVHFSNLSVSHVVKHQIGSDACRCPSLSQCVGELVCRLEVFAQVNKDVSSASDRASLMALVNDVMALGVAAVHFTTQTEMFDDGSPAAVAHRLANDVITINGAVEYG